MNDITLEEPNQAKCQSLVYMATKTGALVRPEACEECGACPERALHGHHADYTRPLDVEWLCPKCHRARHPQGNPDRVQLNMRMDEGLLARLDAVRGDIPRNRFIVRAIEQALAADL